MSSNRSRPFFYTVKSFSDGSNAKSDVNVNINGAPAPIDTEGFVGHFMFIHETGNEPGRKPSQTASEKGVVVQLQGKFKTAASMGEQHLTNLWIGGTLVGQLQLGWIMQNVVSLCAKYAKKKTGGRFFLDMGDKTRPSQMGFPLRTLFTFCRTPAEEQPPVLGSAELDALAWAGPGLLEVDTTSTFTLVWKTPYIDLCSWDLLKVPGVSPLPLESVLGEISAANVFIYDLGKAGGSHSNWRDGLILESHFSRGSHGDSWPSSTPGMKQSQADEDIAEGAKTPLDDAASEASEASDGSAAASDEQDCVTERDEQSDSDSSVDSLEEEGIDEHNEDELNALNRTNSEALLQIERWRPRFVEGRQTENFQVQVPYYIEAIDRLRRRKVRVWYILAVANPQEEGGLWWHAKDALDLASACRPKRRLQTFRRGPGARRFTACAVKTLEQFRHVVVEELAEDSKLRTMVLTPAAAGSMTPPQKENMPAENAPESPKHMSPARLARKVRRHMSQKVPLTPPRFFIADSVTCGLAFAHAREGRQDATHEALVGSVHFEGRVCEELMRLSSDGVLRCFTPYDCEKARVSIQTDEILQVTIQPGLFLGRFFPWHVHTFLRVFSFCCASIEEREEWVASLESLMSQDVPAQAAGVQAVKSCSDAGSRSPSMGDGSPERLPTASPANSQPKASVLKPKPAEPGFSFASAKKAAGRVAGGAVSSLRAIAGGQSVPTREALLLMDHTRARRWGRRRRLVLNDRSLVTSPSQPLSPDIAAGVLEKALAVGDQPAMSDLISLMDATCMFKAVTFTDWTDEELLAFWLNVYHCMLVHGYTIFGTPKTKTAMRYFRSRISYLIGPRPMSLREIESMILRFPQADPPAAREARARARQLLGFCRFCRRRAQNDAGSSQGTKSAQPRSPPSPSRPQSSGQRVASRDKAASLKNAEMHQVVTHLCLPNMPSAPWSDKIHACLYLGNPPEAWPLPRQDMRVALILNRGTLSCLSSIAVFSAAQLNAELDDVSRQFVSTFVEVRLQDGRPVQATFPMHCRGILKQLHDDRQTLVRFIWQFMWEDAVALPDQKVQVKFKKFSEDPRQRTQFFQAIFNDVNLQQTQTKYGPEFDVVHGTAKVLATLVEEPRFTPSTTPLTRATLSRVSNSTTAEDMVSRISL